MTEDMNKQNAFRANRNNLLSKQRESDLMLSAGKSRHFEKKKISHDDCRTATYQAAISRDEYELD